MSEWMQDLFDLMAHEQIKLSIMGELGDVSAELSIRHGMRFFFAAHGEGEAFEDTMHNLMTDYDDRKQGRVRTLGA